MICCRLGKLRHFLRRAGGAAPGPDGLPYFAWLIGEGPSILMDVLLKLTTGESMPAWFGECLGVFLPKDVAANELAPEAGPLRRRPGDTRPLGLKNTSNKAVSALLNRCIQPWIRTTGAGMQKGLRCWA